MLDKQCGIFWRKTRVQGHCKEVLFLNRRLVHNLYTQYHQIFKLVSLIKNVLNSSYIFLIFYVFCIKSSLIIQTVNFLLFKGLFLDDKVRFFRENYFSICKYFLIPIIVWWPFNEIHYYLVFSFSNSSGFWW